FVSPDGSASHQILYSFAGELPNALSFRSAESLSATLGAQARLGGDWRAESYLGFGQEIDESASYGLVNSALLAEALGNVADRADTAYSPARDGFFNPFTGRAANGQAVMAAIGSGFSKTRPKSRTLTANLQA